MPTRKVILKILCFLTFVFCVALMTPTGRRPFIYPMICVTQFLDNNVIAALLAITFSIAIALIFGLSVADIKIPDSSLNIFIEGLQISLIHLLGMTIGAGMIIPIVMYQIQFYQNEVVDLSIGNVILMGIYNICLVMVGTWTSLGAFGRWAGNRGGVLLRIVVQLLGIVIGALLTLPVAYVVTLILMWRIGSRTESKN